MNTILLPTAYLPPISWMAAMLHSENIRIEIFETYPKQTYRNRCIIATSHGKFNLSVPVKKINGNHTMTKDIMVDNSKKWQLIHWRSIETAYSKSPYFLFYRDSLETIYHNTYEHLILLNQDLLNTISKLLGIDIKKITFTEVYFPEPKEFNLRNSFNPKSNPHSLLASPMPRYIQTFEEIHGFLPDLSILDILFNLGPQSKQYLANLPAITNLY